MATYPKFRHLTVERVEGIALITLPGSPVPDTEIHDSLYHELHDVWLPLSRDPEVEAVVVTGVGDQLLKRQLPETNQLMTQSALYDRALRMITAQQLVHQIVTFPKPFVAAVNGHGSEHFLYADVVVASETATFGDDHHVMDDLASGDGNPVMWPFLVGFARAKQVLLQGLRFDAQRALELGFVHEVVPQDKVREAGLAAARRLADLPKLPFLATKLSVNNWFRFASLLAMEPGSAYQAAGMGAERWTASHA